MSTNELIHALAQDAKAVTPLASPARRLVLWLAVSLVYSMAVISVMSLRHDILDKLNDARFLLEVSAAFMTAILAALAAFSAVSPGRPEWERWLPLPALSVWLGSLGEGCVRSLLAMGGGALAFHPEFECIPNVFFAGLVPGALALWMIRKGAPITPVVATSLATLAAAAFAAGTLRLYHAEDASLMVLVWQFGTVALFTLAGAAIGKRWLRWSSPLPQMR